MFFGFSINQFISSELSVGIHTNRNSIRNHRVPVGEDTYRFNDVLNYPKALAWGKDQSKSGLYPQRGNHFDMTRYRRRAQ